MIDRLLAMLEEHRDGYLSGEQISRQLGVSRTAVWKHIRALKKRGYEFEAVPSRGYRLKSGPELFQPERFHAALATRAFGRRLIYLERTGSTQTVAHERYAAGDGEGTVVLAEEQTAGKGRMGRSWHSPRGKGLWFTLLLEPRISVRAAPQLTYVLSVAVCRAIRRATGLAAAIKWPNDIWIDGKKVCGILLESAAEDDRLKYVAAGIGIDVNVDRSEWPAEIADRATSLRAAAGRPFERERLLADCLLELEFWYHHFWKEGFPGVRTVWESLCETIGRTVRLGTGTASIAGVAVGMDDEGALLVRRDDGTIDRVVSGDIEHSMGCAFR